MSFVPASRGSADVDQGKPGICVFAMSRSFCIWESNHRKPYLCYWSSRCTWRMSQSCVVDHSLSLWSTPAATWKTVESCHDLGSRLKAWFIESRSLGSEVDVPDSLLWIYLTCSLFEVAAMTVGWHYTGSPCRGKVARWQYPPRKHLSHLCWSHHGVVHGVVHGDAPRLRRGSSRL